MSISGNTMNINTLTVGGVSLHTFMDDITAKTSTLPESLTVNRFTCKSQITPFSITRYFKNKSNLLENTSYMFLTLPTKGYIPNIMVLKVRVNIGMAQYATLCCAYGECSFFYQGYDSGYSLSKCETPAIRAGLFSVSGNKISIQIPSNGTAANTGSMLIELEQTKRYDTNNTTIYTVNDEVFTEIK